jgi:pimeloyl-ACP methyl ester carboxylesterase
MKLEIISRVPQGDFHTTPILFIHGAWHGAWCWDEHFLPYFAERGYASHAVSLRGHGQSESPSHFKWMRIEDYVEDVAQTVKQLSDPPVMIGHSMGGLVVQKYLETHALPGGVLLAPVPVKGVFRTALRIAGRHPLAFLKANLCWSLYPIIGTQELAREAFFSESLPPKKCDDYFQLMQDESYLAFLDMLLFNLPRPEKISTKLLILGAGQDTIFHANEIEATAAVYGQQPIYFEDMAHDMMLEPGWRAVAERIIDWFNEQGI